MEAAASLPSPRRSPRSTKTDKRPAPTEPTIPQTPKRAKRAKRAAPLTPESPSTDPSALPLAEAPEAPSGTDDADDEGSAVADTQAVEVAVEIPKGHPHADHPAVAHFVKADPALARIISRSPSPCALLEPANERCNTFRSLVRAVIYQQLSGKVAGKILDRFVRYFVQRDDGEVLDEDRGHSDTGAFPTPSQVAAADHAGLLSCGLSNNKARFISGIAAHYVAGTLSDDVLRGATAEGVREALKGVKGVGPWTVDMFLMFDLKHGDVLPVGDLGVRKGFAKHFKLRGPLKRSAVTSTPDGSPATPSKKKQKVERTKDGLYLPTPEEMEALAERWRPWRSVGSFYMWRLVETEVMD